jgi:hypothetical protein
MRAGKSYVTDPTVKIPPETYALARAAAIADGRTLRGLLDRAIRQYLAAHQPELLKSQGGAR